MGKTLRFSAIVYNHYTFPLLLERKVLHKLKVFIDWNLSKWYVKSGKRTKVQISINFDTNHSIKRIVISDFTSEDKFEMEEATTTSKATSSNENYLDYEIFIFQQDTYNNADQITNTPEGNI